MKRKYYLLTAAALASLVSGCGGRDGSASDSGITEFQVCETLLTADRNYKMATEYGDVYLDLYTSLHWPEKLGENDLGVLQDSILYYAYGDTVATDVRKAVKAFAADISVVDGATLISEVDSLPEDQMTYSNSVVGSIIEVNEEMLTYQVVTSSYLGGAHPMTATRPFTYSFAQKEVLSNDNMFVEGVTADSIMPMIREALARQLSVPVSGLERAGIFTSQLTYPGRPYIASNTLYFHYDPYEIGPYSLGAVDVAVYPGEIDSFLRPEIRSLFDQGL